MRIYLLCPYTHPEPWMREHRATWADYAAAYLMHFGNTVFSPISHSHRIGKILKNSVDCDYWLEQCLEYIDWADCGYILTIDGWDQSKGVKIEEKAFKDKGKNVYLLDQFEVTVWRLWQKPEHYQGRMDN